MREHSVAANNKLSGFDLLMYTSECSALIMLCRDFSA